MNQKTCLLAPGCLAPPEGAVAVLVNGPFDSGLTPDGDDGGPCWPLVWIDTEGFELELIGHADAYEAACAWGREIARTNRLELDVEAMPA